MEINDETNSIVIGDWKYMIDYKIINWVIVDQFIVVGIAVGTIVETKLTISIAVVIIIEIIIDIVVVDLAKIGIEIAIENILSLHKHSTGLPIGNWPECNVQLLSNWKYLLFP